MEDTEAESVQEPTSIIDRRNLMTHTGRLSLGWWLIMSFFRLSSRTVIDENPIGLRSNFDLTKNNRSSSAPQNGQKIL